MDGVILLGDSVFFGIGASTRACGSGKLIKKGLQRPVLIKSFNLHTTNDALSSIESYLQEYEEYSYYVINFGNNDCKLVAPDLPKVDIIKYKENLIHLVSKIKGCSKVPILCNLQPISNDGFYRTYKEIAGFIKDLAPNPFLWQQKYSDACKEAALDLNINFIDIRSPLEKAQNNIWWHDGMHPNDEGHAIISQTVISSLAKIDIL
jgi:hypothetical protein